MTRTVYTVLTVTSCSQCYVPFAVPKEFWDNGWNYGGEIYCPRGHRMTFGPGRVKEMEQEAVRLRARLDQQQARAAHMERSRSAVKGQLTKVRRRVGNGICPCCNRTFSDLAKHMTNQHPEYADGEVKDFEEAKPEPRPRAKVKKQTAAEQAAAAHQRALKKLGKGTGA